MKGEQLAPGVYAVYGPGGMANAGFILGKEEVLVVDTMMTPSMARGLVKNIQEATSLPVGFVINTHHHGDHTFGNQFFPTAAIAAHRAVRSRMEELGESMITRMLRFRPELKEEFKEVRLTLPCLTYSDRLTFYLAGRAVEVSYIGHPGHTGGDSMVYLPQEGILFAGDILFTRIIPAMQPDGSSTGWLETLKQIEGMEVKSIVPGHGALSTKADIKALQDYLLRLRQEVSKCLSQGMTREETVKAVNLEPFASWDQQVRNEGNISIAYSELEQARKG